jgi:hypothetical protein
MTKLEGKFAKPLRKWGDRLDLTGCFISAEVHFPLEATGIRPALERVRLTSKTSTHDNHIKGKHHGTHKEDEMENERS